MCDSFVPTKSFLPGFQLNLALCRRVLAAIIVVAEVTISCFPVMGVAVSHADLHWSFQQSQEGLTHTSSNNGPGEWSEGGQVKPNQPNQWSQP